MGDIFHTFNFLSYVTFIHSDMWCLCNSWRAYYLAAVCRLSVVNVYLVIVAMLLIGPVVFCACRILRRILYQWYAALNLQSGLNLRRICKFNKFLPLALCVICAILQFLPIYLRQSECWLLFWAQERDENEKLVLNFDPSFNFLYFCMHMS